MMPENKISVVEIDGQVPPIAEDGITFSSKITMNFSLSLEGEQSDKLIDSNFGKAPVTFIFGDGNLLPGFEKHLIGLRAEDDETFLLDPDNAFGPINPDNIQVYPRFQFPADLMLEKGVMVSFSDVGGNNQAGVVKKFDSKTVEVDFNHPLAGEAIKFRVKIIAIEVA